MKTTKLFFVLASVLIFIVLLPTTNSIAQVIATSVDKTVYVYKPSQVQLNKLDGVTADSLSMVNGWKLDYSLYSSLNYTKTFTRFIRGDKVEGISSQEFAAAGTGDFSDPYAFASMRFLKSGFNHVTEPDSFFVYVKVLDMDTTITFLGVQVYYLGDSTYSELGMKKLVVDGKWHKLSIFNPLGGIFKPSPIIGIGLKFGMDLSGTNAVPFSFATLVDDLEVKYNQTGTIEKWDGFNDTTTDVSGGLSVPTEFKLEQNYPNPFNPATIIKFSVPQMERVNLKVYDLLGREVATLVNEEKAPGSYEVKFDGSNLASGTYFYRLQAGDFVQVKKMMLMK